MAEEHFDEHVEAEVMPENSHPPEIQENQEIQKIQEIQGSDNDLDGSGGGSDDVAAAAAAAAADAPTEAPTETPTAAPTADTPGVPEKKWPGWPGENVFRMLVPVQKVGGIIGRKGEYIKKTCEETKARIKILDGPPGTTERTVLAI